MKFFALAVLLSSFAIAKDRLPDACGPDVSFKRLNGMPAMARLDNGKALIYIIGFGKYAADGHMLGEVDRSYSTVQLTPGEHHLCGEFRLGFHTVVALHSLNVKAGETYYVEMGFAGRGPYAFKILDPDEAGYRISKLPFTVSTPK